MEQQKESVFKVTLGSGKVVILRELKIQHQELAAKAAAPRAGDNAMLLAMAMQKEIIKMLLVEIDGHVLSANEKENLDKILSYKEYNQIQKVVQQISGSDDMGNESMEIVPYGNT
jgi:hypothetical protein